MNQKPLNELLKDLRFCKYDSYCRNIAHLIMAKFDAIKKDRDELKAHQELLSKQLLQSRCYKEQITVLHKFLNRTPMESLAEIEAMAIEENILHKLHHRYFGVSDKEDAPFVRVSEIKEQISNIRSQAKGRIR